MNVDMGSKFFFISTENVRNVTNIKKLCLSDHVDSSVKMATKSIRISILITFIGLLLESVIFENSFYLLI